jgi:hypothetical protein
MHRTDSGQGGFGYTSLEQIQEDLDEFLREYNEERTNQGKYCAGRTPTETFIAGLELCKQYVYAGKEAA